MKSFARSQLRVAGAVLAGILAAIGVAYAADPAPSPSLAPPENFAGIADTQQRSAAMFTELGKV